MRTSPSKCVTVISGGGGTCALQQPSQSCKKHLIRGSEAAKRDGARHLAITSKNTLMALADKDSAFGGLPPDLCSAPISSWKTSGAKSQ